MSSVHEFCVSKTRLRNKGNLFSLPGNVIMRFEGALNCELQLLDWVFCCHLGFTLHSRCILMCSFLEYHLMVHWNFKKKSQRLALFFVPILKFIMSWRLLTITCSSYSIKTCVIIHHDFLSNLRLIGYVNGFERLIIFYYYVPRKVPSNSSSPPSAWTRRSWSIEVCFAYRGLSRILLKRNIKTVHQTWTKPHGGNAVRNYYISFEWQNIEKKAKLRWCKLKTKTSQKNFRRWQERRTTQTHFIWEPLWNKWWNPCNEHGPNHSPASPTLPVLRRFVEEILFWENAYPDDELQTTDILQMCLKVLEAFRKPRFLCITARIEIRGWP